MENPLERQRCETCGQRDFADVAPCRALSIGVTAGRASCRVSGSCAPKNCPVATPRLTFPVAIPLALGIRPLALLLEPVAVALHQDGVTGTVQALDDGGGQAPRRAPSGIRVARLIGQSIRSLAISDPRCGRLTIAGPERADVDMEA